MNHEHTLQMRAINIPMFSDRELTPGGMFRAGLPPGRDPELTSTLEVRGILAMRYRARLRHSHSDLLLDARCRLFKAWFGGEIANRRPSYIHERLKIQSFAFSGGLVDE